ncbi:MAG: hypothetical protein OEO23_14030, partial [Gemmatimonadota bacterium]|nr:hypothetical protein [Gemmatimonadota bacterium]
MMRTLLRAASVLWIGAGLAACASREPHVHLEPGVQRTDASVDLERGSVTQEEEGVSVTAQAAMLPEPRGSVPRPTFWITVENHRDEPIRVTPADARLIDTFGAQHSPLPVTVDGARERYPRYALVDPEIRTYVS